LTALVLNVKEIIKLNQCSRDYVRAARIFANHIYIYISKLSFENLWI